MKVHHNEPAPTFDAPQTEYEADCVRTSHSQAAAVVGLLLIAAGTATFAGSVLLIQAVDKVLASERASRITARVLGLLLLALLSSQLIIR